MVAKLIMVHIVVKVQTVVVGQTVVVVQIIIELIMVNIDSCCCELHKGLVRIVFKGFAVIVIRISIKKQVSLISLTFYKIQI